MASNRKTITAHCIIKNEENFVGFAIRSVIDYVEKVLIFDTGSTDKTVDIIEQLVKEYPKKIIFEKKGDCPKEKHSVLRQEMLDKTRTDWFMIVDGDEVHTKRGMEEAIDLINSRDDLDWIVSPYYLCVGDIYHIYKKEWYNEFWGRSGCFTPRFIKKIDGIYWSGNYEEDTLYRQDGVKFFNNKYLFFLKNKYWHLTYLERSSADRDVYTSGIEKTRQGKRRLTYFMIGKKIIESPPEVLINLKKMGYLESLLNFYKLLLMKPSLLFRRLLYKIKR